MKKQHLTTLSQKRRYLATFVAVALLLFGYSPFIWAQNTMPQDSLFRYVEQRPKDNKTLYHLDGTLADSQQIALDHYGNVTQTVDLSRLSNGLYMVCVSDGGQHWSQKLQVIQ